MKVPVTLEQLQHLKEKISSYLKQFSAKKMKHFVRLVSVVLGILVSLGLVYFFLVRETFDSVSYWYREHPAIKFSSYSRPYYGFFVAELEMYFACTSEDLFEELEQKRVKVTNLLRQVVSEQDYYQINTEVKRSYNLTPRIIQSLNMIVKSGRIVDVVYHKAFFVKKTDQSYKEYQDMRYVDMGSHELIIHHKNYYFEFYIVVDSDPPRFMDALVHNTEHLKELIVNHLYMNRERYEEQDVLVKAQQEIHALISEKASDFIRVLEHDLKQKHPLLKNKNYYVDTIFGLFYQKDAHH